MHKKKAPASKILVRNPERPLPKTTLVNHYAAKENDQKKKSSLEKPSSSDRESKVHFKSPELNTMHVLAKKIESVENLKPRKVKCASLTEEKLAIEEKVTKHMNFPLDQPIYRNLIPLCSTKPVSHPSLVPSRPPLPNKDVEPSLSDFYIPKRNSEYSYKPVVINKSISVVKDADCLKLYRIMQTWNVI